MKVMVLGLDGATWDVLEPLIRQDLLPNLARLREQGSWGMLGSVFPPLSPVAWTGVMTGKNSGKHGIFEFVEHRHDPLEGRVNSSRAVQSKLIWEIAAQHGKRTVAGGVPMSYPPRPAGRFPGFFLGDFLSPASAPDFSSDPELFAELENVGWAVSSLGDGHPRRRQRVGRARRLAGLPGAASAHRLVPDEPVRLGPVPLRPDGDGSLAA